MCCLSFVTEQSCSAACLKAVYAAFLFLYRFEQHADKVPHCRMYMRSGLPQSGDSNDNGEPSIREIAQLLARFACNAHTICDDELRPIGARSLRRNASLAQFTSAAAATVSDLCFQLAPALAQVEEQLVSGL